MFVHVHNLSDYRSKLATLIYLMLYLCLMEITNIGWIKCLNASRKKILLFRLHRKAVVAKTTYSHRSTSHPMSPHHQTIHCSAPLMLGFPSPVDMKPTRFVDCWGNHQPINRNIRLDPKPTKVGPPTSPMAYPILQEWNTGQLGWSQRLGWPQLCRYWGCSDQCYMCRRRVDLSRVRMQPGSAPSSGESIRNAWRL